MDEPRFLSELSLAAASAEVDIVAEPYAYSGRLITKAPKRQSVRFVLVGSATASLDYLTLFLLTSQLGQGYLLSAAVGFMLGSICNYLLSVRWVFVPGKFRKDLEFSFFIITGLVGLALNQLTMWFFVSVPRINYLYAKVFAVVIVTVCNFLSKKRLVFVR